MRVSALPQWKTPVKMHLRRSTGPSECHNGSSRVHFQEKLVSCAICHIRKEKRFCPAVHGRICALCCGTEREVTFDCPSDCVYLQQARQHERTRKLEELDQAALFPKVEVRDQVLYEREPLLVGLTFGIMKAARADRMLRDRDAIT